MLHPEVYDGHGYYYPIGNSPAINLVGHLPPEFDAEVLLLGCGDVRNILFTIFTESTATPSEVHRRYHFTCCDVEAAVIARNILLLLMVLKNEDTSIMWPIYYDIFMSEKCSEALKRHLEELLSISMDVDSWSKSDIGQLLNVGSRYTLTAVRRLWSVWMEGLGDKVKENQLRKSYEHGISVIKKKHRNSSIVSIARSAGPLCLDVLNASSEHFRHYWENGTTDNNAKRPSVPNPTFSQSKYGQKFSVHYGTNPLAGFHLSTAIVPFTSKDGSARSFSPLNKSSDFAPLIACAKEEFNLWCKYFKESRTNNEWTICFFVDEALELCSALSQADYTISSIGIREINEANATSKGYLYNHPTQFNVIDISNLIDHTGTYNILLSILPLLRKDHISYLNTETLLDSEFDPSHGEEGLFNVLGVDPTSLFTLLGIAPVDFICGQTGISQVSERMLEAFDTRSHTQKHGRLVWKWIPLFQPEGVSQRHGLSSPQSKFTYDTHAMIEFLAGVYKKLFAIENHAWAFQQVSRSLQTKGFLNMLQHNTRATFSLLLQNIKRVTSETVDWDGLVEKLDSVVTNECGCFIASCFLQEQNVLNHLYGVYTVDYLQEHPGVAAFKYGQGMGSLFDRFEEHDTITCVTLSVPRRALEKFEMRRIDEIGTPPLQLTLSSGMMMNHFCVLHRRFGKLDSINIWDARRVYIQKDAPIIREDLDGWAGKSTVIYSCMVPTWFLLLDGCQVSLDIVSTPVTAILTTEFGHAMTLFKASVLDHEKVRLSAKFPLTIPPNAPLPNNGTVPDSAGHPGKSRSEPSGSSEQSKRKNELGSGDLEKAPTYKLLFVTGSRPKIGRILYHWSVESDKSLVKLLEDRAPISTTRIGASTIKINLGPGFKLVNFPFPVGEATKLAIARKSKYIEIDAPLFNGTDAPVYLYFPAGIADKSIRSVFPWSLHRINLDKSPPLLVDIPKFSKEKYEWVNSVATFAFSKKERANINSTSSKFFGDILSEIKETIHMIFVRYLGIQGFKHSTFVLSCDNVGGYMLVYVKDIRLDLSGQNVVADCALVPFEDDTLQELAPILVNLRNAPVKNSPEETKAWLQLAVSLVERCRTWKHKMDCEYIRFAGVPSSAPDLKIGASPLCSCGKGIFPKTFHDDPIIKPLLPYATRAAIGPLFPPPYSKELQSLAGLISAMEGGLNLSGASRPAVGKRACALCGKGESKDRKLKKCAACMKVEYCSKECQKKDWKAHKKTHKS